MSKPAAVEIYAKLTTILRDVFDDDELLVTPALRAPDVDGWDSMGNVNLFLAIEQSFGIRFGAGEMGEIQNVGELVDLIQRKL